MQRELCPAADAAIADVPALHAALARAAGHDAGFAMSTTLRELRANGDTGVLLDAIREWEDARRSHAFTSAQRAQLKDPAREFHLEPRAKKGIPGLQLVDIGVPFYVKGPWNKPSFGPDAGGLAKGIVNKLGDDAKLPADLLKNPGQTLRSLFGGSR